MDLICCCWDELRSSSASSRPPLPCPCQRLVTKWQTRKMSCVAKEKPKATEDPTKNPIAVEPNIALGRLAAALLRQIMLATETAAATAHRNRPAPNQMPPKRRRRVIGAHDTRYEQANGVTTTRTTTSSVAATMAVILTADAGFVIDCARIMWMTRTAVVERVAVVPSTAGRRRGITMPPRAARTRTVKIRGNKQGRVKAGKGRMSASYPPTRWFDFTRWEQPPTRRKHTQESWSSADPPLFGPNKRQ